MLDFRVLDRIAKIIAAQVSEIRLRDDIYQSAWVRFLRYDPRTHAGAWMMARHARNDVLRSEHAYQHRKTAEAPPPPDEMEGLMAKLELEHLAESNPRAFWRYLGFGKRGKRSRRMRHYYRQRLREIR